MPLSEDDKGAGFTLSRRKTREGLIDIPGQLSYPPTHTNPF